MDITISILSRSNRHIRNCLSYHVLSIHDIKIIGITILNMRYVSDIRLYNRLKILLRLCCLSTNDVYDMYNQYNMFTNALLKIRVRSSYHKTRYLAKLFLNLLVSGKKLLKYIKSDHDVLTKETFETYANKLRLQERIFFSGSGFVYKLQNIKQLNQEVEGGCVIKNFDEQQWEECNSEEILRRLIDFVNTVTPTFVQKSLKLNMIRQTQFLKYSYKDKVDYFRKTHHRLLIYLSNIIQLHDRFHTYHSLISNIIRNEKFTVTMQNNTLLNMISKINLNDITELVVDDILAKM